MFLFFVGEKRYIKSSHLSILERIFEKQFKLPSSLKLWQKLKGIIYSSSSSSSPSLEEKKTKLKLNYISTSK
jgi:hypothetical protein